ncbi:ornithine cyclodeaminase family protein [Pseudomonas sp. dw_612]|uniref:ornithine cyclodeaminase family protein n=1 Tax=Pseudomonas sp. dw_612 TaxID=2720080 RepID=UPI001BD319BD|nr:ornithine cyclodeaminase family protein [Pseudomonas sp. dw_612]
MSSTPYVINQQQARELLAQVDVPQILCKLFRDLAAGRAVQPAQQLVEFPQGAGDFINYLGVLAEDGVYGVKTSPYIVREQGPLVTAWTLLMSMQTGQPLLLCDAGELTTARTAATTAVAVDALAPLNARRLAIIGSGKVAQAHLHYVKGLRDWQSISQYSPGLSELSTGARAQLQSLDPRLTLVDSREAAIKDADVIMLCTSSAGPVIDPATLSKPALITSISTNAPRAHEVPPQRLNDMQVFCDYRQTTPGSAGEMLIAGEHHGWDKRAIVGDLPDLLSGKVQRPDYDRHVFFRSIGLGLEDIALANALYRLQP